jgi:beta-glucanase (GH16 family)
MIFTTHNIKITKMKKLIINMFAVLGLLLIVSCQEETKSFGALDAPVNLVVTAQIVGQNTTTAINGDGPGKVLFTATADNAISYRYVFGDGSSQNSPSGVFEKRYNQTGLNTYTVTIIATGKGGIAATTTMEVTVLSNFEDPQSVAFLTGGTQKTWYWSASEAGHLGVGPNSDDNSQNYYAHWYQAVPWEKAGSSESSCLYGNELTFSLVGNQLKFQLNNQGQTFFNKDFRSVVGGTSANDACYNYNVGGLKNVNLGPSESVVMASPDHLTRTTGTMMNFSDGGFMGYYIGQSSYEILSISATRMTVRAIMGGNPALAWYHTFTTIQPTQDATDYTNLVFSDEFSTDGAPDANKWTYDLGNNNGWGNGELQTYTNSSNNVVVQGGNLVITAKKTGSSYTSARLKSENKYEFKYGKVEFNAKLPAGAGTWPALWMLGQNYATNIWPACGEIDIMEHKGNQPNIILGSVHYTGRSAGNSVTSQTSATSVSTTFHKYKVIWSPQSIRFFVDNVLFHSVINTNSLPFNSDFFLIMNVAMGGTFGGTVDPAFTQSSMEVDYVRVYQ